MKSLLTPMIATGLGLAILALPAKAETIVEITTDADGVTWVMDADSREVYTNEYGVTQVDFYLSTEDDDTWHNATASCDPYDVLSEHYGWEWSGTDSLPPGTVGGDIARAVCSD